MKTFKTQNQINDLVESANSIVTKSDFQRLNAIGRKYGIELKHDKLTNLQLWWDEQIKAIDDLKPRDAFRLNLMEDRVWQYRHDSEYMHKFIEYKILHPEYHFLCDRKWDQLEHFACSYLPMSDIRFEGGVRILIATEGNYEKFFSQFDKNHCDKDALKTSAKLYQTIESIFSGLDHTERYVIGNAIRNYATSTEPIDYETFHNSLFTN